MARVLPYLLFALLYWAKDQLHLHPAFGAALVYSGVGLSLFLYRRYYTELSLFRSGGGTWIIGVLVGLLGGALWFLPYRLWPELHVTDSLFGFLGAGRPAVDWSQFSSSSYVFIYLFSRSVGYVFVTPLFEEIFIRSFLIRYLVDSRFQTVSTGTYTHLSFWVTSLFFALTHPEWVVALFYAVLFNTVLCITKNFNVCVIGHIISNLLLTLYVWATGDIGMW
jgi:hypothetical protein